MNVVPRSTMNTNGGTHWALALVKGIMEPHEVKKKSFELDGNRTNHNLGFKHHRNKCTISKIGAFFKMENFFP